MVLFMSQSLLLTLQPISALSKASRVMAYEVLQCHRLALSKRPLGLIGQMLRRQHSSTTITHGTVAAWRRFEKIDLATLMEEETVRGYKPEHFYPVHISQMFNDRQQTIGKLGYGSASTVWLCRDLRRKSAYAALKVYINCSKVQRELPIYEHINNLHSEHQGRDHVRKFLESFTVKGPHGKHLCLVHQPLGVSLDELRASGPDGVLPAAVIRELFRWIIRGLQFLHEEAHVIHMDLQPSNILMGIEDDSAFSEFASHEAEQPSPRLPSLSDLSEARFGDCENTDDIVPDEYRAPEVVLGMPWSYPVDIWSIEMVIWQLFEGRRLFSARNPNGHYSERYHLAQLVAILGPPPVDFLRKSEKSKRFWDSEGRLPSIGNLRGEAPIPDTSLESVETRLNGKEKETFLSFMRKMLQWEPEQRGHGRDIFFNEWLLADLIESGVIALPEGCDKV